MIHMLKTLTTKRELLMSFGLRSLVQKAAILTVYSKMTAVI